jgi:hypothetical protein
MTQSDDMFCAGREATIDFPKTKNNDDKPQCFRKNFNIFVLIEIISLSLQKN